MSFTTMVGFFATATSVAFIWPQVVRVFAKNSTEGISPYSFLQGCSGSLMWTIYGLNKPEGQVALSNGLLVVALSLILFVCVKHQKISWMIPVFTLVAVSIAGTFIANYSITMMGWCTVAIGAPAIIPQIVRVYRTEHLYGVSAAMYGLLSFNCLMWLIYGAMIDDWFVSLPNIITTLGAFYIMVRAVKSHKKFQAPAEAPAN
ncbi:MAG: SemiSWEET family transporter [Ilumatobacteraceae bacterium]|nr:SemiSWEET family transporter [Ilumatobacteraceae bacterium]MDP4695548.1 SemiSWEET family transporter [Ilumatobacteraceae bacterium]MDP4903065.1 SemiSWEET family transporter [Ilumatobacteraceae bacterium]